MKDKKTILDLFQENGLCTCGKPVISMLGLAKFCLGKNDANALAAKLRGDKSPSAVAKGVTYDLTPSDIELIATKLKEIRRNLGAVISDLEEMK